MAPSFSLEYYDRIFGTRTPAYAELLGALAEELEAYARDLPDVVASGDAVALGRLRHSHRPLVDNLALDRLRSLEDDLREAVEGRQSRAAEVATQLADEARTVSRLLTSERLLGGPGPQPPVPGG